MEALYADIVAVGSELLLGGGVEKNSIFISHLVAECGIDIRKKISVGDHKSHIQEVLRESLKQSDVIILSGGLGSTFDDCTREAIAETFGCSLIRQKKAYEQLQARYRRLGRAITPLLAKQALIPSGAMMLANSVGTAPGFLLRKGPTLIVALPGVPREAREMMASQVQPVLRKIFKSPRRSLFHTFNTFGLPETDIQRHLDPILKEYAHIQFGLLASPEGVKVTLRWWVSIPSPSSVKMLPTVLEWDHLIVRVRTCLRPWLFSEGEQTLEEIVGGLLRNHSWTIALAESCTGGLIAHRLTEIPGSSLYFDRGFVSYSNQSKIEFVGVSAALVRRYGAVSSQVAKAMAKGIRIRSRTEVGVGVTGIAGPGGGTVKKPVGLVFGSIDGPRGGQCHCWQFRGNRSEIKFKTSQAVLDLIRRYANEAEIT